MRLKELLNSLEIIKADNLLDFEVQGITDNSKEVGDGFLFVAVRGAKFNGCDFIKEAIKKGARGIVIGNNLETGNHKSVVFVHVQDPRRAVWQLASKFYGFPSQRLKCIGITGTNGKTTITYLLESILNQANFSCGMIGTINYHFNNTVIPAANTTPNSVFLQSMLYDMASSGVTHCVLEVSSHSLEQQRVGGIEFKYAIFTNLASDHLDYHKNRLSYFEAKTKLFKILKKEACAVINIDDNYGAQLSRYTAANIITYGIDKSCDIKARDLKLTPEGGEFKVKTSEGEFEVRTRLIGRHNVYNILAATAMAISEGISLETIRKGVYNLSKVEGRLEEIDGGSSYKIFIDYAHTEDALKNVLLSLRGIRPSDKFGRTIVVFGCGGDRDRSKRPRMGFIASKFADLVIITSDNPRNEEPRKIIEDIVSGISSGRSRIIEIIPDRYSAIEKALSVAEKGDIVLIAGKGHEQYQVTGNKKIHFDDREVVREILNKNSKSEYRSSK